MNTATNTYVEALPRIPSQRERILDELREAGSIGITNVNFYEISKSWWARVQELIMMGYKISVTNIDNGVYRYVLEEEPKKLREKPVKAIEELNEMIEILFDGTVTTDDLAELLEVLNFKVVREKGFYHKQNQSN